MRLRKRRCAASRGREWRQPTHDTPHATNDTEASMARITLRQLLDHAAERGYGVPAFNINNMEQGLAIMEAAAAVDAPVIIQASRGAPPSPPHLMPSNIIHPLEKMYP